MPWQEQKPEDVKWWDIVVPGPLVYGPIHLSEDNAFVDQEIHYWLASRYGHNIGYQRVSGPKRQAGLPTYAFWKFVRFYNRFQSIHFALVWL